jgi:hypothetical protein
VDWKRSGEPLLEPATGGGKPGDQIYLFLGGLTPTTWVEAEVAFAGADLTGPKFRQIGAQFQQFVQSTRRDYRRSEEYSLDLSDHWGRRLGPAATGKLASNDWWYIYFVQENGEWRVWKLELAIH